MFNFIFTPWRNSDLTYVLQLSWKMYNEVASILEIPLCAKVDHVILLLSCMVGLVGAQTL